LFDGGRWWGEFDFNFFIGVGVLKCEFPFPEIKKRIEGILSVNVKEEVWLRMNSI